MHDIEKYLNNVLKPDDTFQFSCKMCGACCRKRDDPIVLTLLTALYLDYDVTKPYEEQAERNRKKIRTYLARKFTSKQK